MVDGKYVYEVNESSYSFWQDILFDTNAEIINHSYTHGFWGTNDDGGTFEYVKNGESVVTLSELMPKGSSTKEIYASKQILEELFPNNISINSAALSFITPGIGIKTVDHKLSDGSVVATYKTYFNEVLKKAYASGDLIGANSTFGATYDPSLDLSTKVVTKDNFSTYESRMAIPRYMVEHYNANPDGLVNDDISNWTDYIDSAIDLNGWACFCIHMIIENASADGHNITEAQAEKLFKYAIDNNTWVATNTEAVLYFSEWSTSSVSAEYTDGFGAGISVNADKIRFNIRYCNLKQAVDFGGHRFFNEVGVSCVKDPYNVHKKLKYVSANTNVISYFLGAPLARHVLEKKAEWVFFYLFRGEEELKFAQILQKREGI